MEFIDVGNSIQKLIVNYAVITEEWKQRNNKGQFILPTVNRMAMEAMYKNI